MSSSCSGGDNPRTALEKSKQELSAIRVQQREKEDAMKGLLETIQRHSKTLRESKKASTSSRGKDENEENRSTQNDDDYDGCGVDSDETLRLLERSILDMQAQLRESCNLRHQHEQYVEEVTDLQINQHFESSGTNHQLDTSYTSGVSNKLMMSITGEVDDEGVIKEGATANLRTDPHFSMNTLMLSSVMGVLPTPLQQAYLCSSGIHGYASFKEMLQCGKAGRMMLLESEDIREFSSIVKSKKHSSRIFKFDLEDWFDTARSPRGVRHAIITTNLKRVPPSFLEDCTQLRSIDLGGLSQMTQLSGNFLSGCTGLTSIDLHPLSQLQELPQHFLSECSGLKMIDLTPLSGLKKLPAGFLSKCSGFTTIDLTPFSSQIEEVPPGFLGGCKGLKEIDLTPFSNVTTILGRFLADCCGLTSIDLGPLSNISVISEEFLSGCTGLMSVDFSPLGNVVFIHPNLLAGCGELSITPIRPVKGGFSHIEFIQTPPPFGGDDRGFRKKCMGSPHPSTRASSREGCGCIVA